MKTNQKEVYFMSGDQIEALEMEIDALPVGYISRKNINGKKPTNFLRGSHYFNLL